MRLYFHPFSSNSRRAAMTVLHLGLPVEFVTIELVKGEQRRPEFLHMNPNGTVPVLEDNGFYLSESHAIMQYLAVKAAADGARQVGARESQDVAAAVAVAKSSSIASSVYPGDLRGRADIDRWMFWNAQHFQPAIGIFVWENLVKGMIGQGPADPARIKEGEQKLERYATVLDAHLADRRWVSGANLTLADLAIAATLSAATPANAPLQPYRNMKSWFESVQALDAWKRTAFDFQGRVVREVTGAAEAA